MHPSLQYAHVWLLEGPLGVPGICDIVVEYATCWIKTLLWITSSPLPYNQYLSCDKLTLHKKNILHAQGS